MDNTAPRIDPASIVMPDGWALREDGSAVKEVRDAKGQVVARLSTQEVFMPQIVLPLWRAPQ